MEGTGNGANLALMSIDPVTVPFRTCNELETDRSHRALSMSSPNEVRDLGPRAQLAGPRSLASLGMTICGRETIPTALQPTDSLAMLAARE